MSAASDIGEAKRLKTRIDKTVALFTGRLYWDEAGSGPDLLLPTSHPSDLCRPRLQSGNPVENGGLNEVRLVSGCGEFLACQLLAGNGVTRARPDASGEVSKVRLGHVGEHVRHENLDDERQGRDLGGQVDFNTHSNCSPLSLDARREARLAAGSTCPLAYGEAPPCSEPEDVQ